jgi:hypothetical protein
MKKILSALAIAGVVACFSANAQTTVACGAPEGKVCRANSKGKSCYPTKYAENYKVCKGGYGYYICCEDPNSTNSTFPKLLYTGPYPYRSDDQQAYAMQSRTTEDGIKVDMAVPQSQSYPQYSANVATTYGGNYPNGHIKVCSNTDNVAEENRAPYIGCPTPAYDGPDKNQQRNINVSNPNASFPQPPNTGRPQ